jgi:hypothetical protein
MPPINFKNHGQYRNALPKQDLCTSVTAAEAPRISYHTQARQGEALASKLFEEGIRCCASAGTCCAYGPCYTYLGEQGRQLRMAL